MQRSAEEILDSFKIDRKHIDPNKRGRQYTTCPQCSEGRTGWNKKAKCLAVNNDGQGLGFFCNHCEWTDGARFEPGKRVLPGHQPKPGGIAARAMPKPTNGYAALHKGAMATWAGKRQ